MPELASGGAVAARDALREALQRPLAGEELSRDEAVALLATPELTTALLATASALRDRAWGRTVTFSPKVFLPLTNLCRDRCTYCTFRKDPDDPDAWTMTPAERVDTLLAIRDLHRAYGHVQEVIVQNFRAKPTIPRADASEPAPEDIARTVAVARLILDADVSVQAPPNLSPADHTLLLAAGLNDWGGISPLTPDYVNPEAPWPHVATLAATCRAAGYTLAERLAIYPAYVDRPGFLAPALRARVAALGEEARTAPGGVEASA